MHIVCGKKTACNRLRPPLPQPRYIFTCQPGMQIGNEHLTWHQAPLESYLIQLPK